MNKNDYVIIGYLKKHGLSDVRQISNGTGIEYELARRRLKKLETWGIVCIRYDILYVSRCVYQLYNKDGNVTV